MHYASLPTSQLSSWALLNNIELRSIRVASDIVNEDGSSKGSGLLATAEHHNGEPLLIVPHDIVLSKDQVIECARTDFKLRELLETLTDSDIITVGLKVICDIHYARLASRGRLQDKFADSIRACRLHAAYSWSSCCIS